MAPPSGGGGACGLYHKFRMSGEARSARRLDSLAGRTLRHLSHGPAAGSDFLEGLDPGGGRGRWSACGCFERHSCLDCRDDDWDREVEGGGDGKEAGGLALPGFTVLPDARLCQRRGIGNESARRGGRLEVRDGDALAKRRLGLIETPGLGLWRWACSASDYAPRGCVVIRHHYPRGCGGRRCFLSGSGGDRVAWVNVP